MVKISIQVKACYVTKESESNKQIYLSVLFHDVQMYVQIKASVWSNDEPRMVHAFYAFYAW
jgi:hypothetical protein